MLFHLSRMKDRKHEEGTANASMKNIRTFAITDYLKKKQYCTLEELMKQFKVSSATIHRDIADLVRRNVVQRVRGGIAFIDDSSRASRIGVPASSYSERANVNRAAKETIADEAIRRIAENDIVFLDSSTTVSYLANRIARSSFANMTVITNSVAVMNAFHDFPSHYVLIGLGGTYDAQLNSFLGQGTIRELERLNITKAFVSAFGINDKIVTTNRDGQAGLLAKVLDLAEKRYLLADRSKFGRTGLYRLCNRGYFDEIFTEG